MKPDDLNKQSEATFAAISSQTEFLLNQVKGNPAALAMLRRELGKLGLASEDVNRILRGEVTAADLPALAAFNHGKN